LSKAYYRDAVAALIKTDGFELTKAIAQDYCQVVIDVSDPLASPLVAMIYVFVSGVLQPSYIALSEHYDFPPGVLVLKGLLGLAVVALQRAVQGLTMKGPKFNARTVVAEVDSALSKPEVATLIEHLTARYSIKWREGRMVAASGDEDSESDNNSHRH
jgi:hypothetical protein